MPRMQPPRGYITMTQAKKLLNISDAMVRTHAKKGKIHYLLPEGREQGFYLKKDVEKLANELNAFLNIEEEEKKEEKPYFTIATEKDLAEIARIGNALFSQRNDSNSTVIVPNWRYTLLEKNPEAQYALKLEDKVIGFTTILPFRPNTDKIETLLRSETVSQANITANDIEKFEPDKHLHLYIGAIGIEPNIEKKRKRRYGAVLISGLISAIINLGKRGIIVDEITALGATHTGVRLLLTFGLHEIPARVPGNRAFTMNVKESGSPVSTQYKQALKEYREQKRKNNKPQKTQEDNSELNTTKGTSQSLA